MLSMVAAPSAQAHHANGDLPLIESAARVTPKDARQLSKLFFERLRSLEEGTAEYSYARGTLVEMNMSLVRFSARRFRSRGQQEMEDVVQVGMVGLIKAIDRFDVGRGPEFTTFAIPYILGEMKRHFRDTTWAVHVPRRLQELRLELAKARDHLTTASDTTPTIAEYAAYLEISQDAVIECMVAANGYMAGSLDVATAGDSEEREGRSYADVLGACDPRMELVEDIQALVPLLKELDTRERRILQLRFGEDMTQSEIGARLGCSQMHVSRLLNTALAKLRTGLLTDR